MTNLRWARPEERDEIQTYLFENMGKISHKQWRNILDCRWNETDDRYGVVVEENGVLAGFLGIVFAERILSGKPCRTGNITSWFLEKHLRRGGLGQEMLALITEPAGVTYTATSANFRSGALLEKIGWQLLEDTRLFWHRSEIASADGIKLLTGASVVEKMLKTEDAKILRDHKHLNLTPHLLLTPTDEKLFFITYVKNKGEAGTAHYEILHTGDSVLLAKHIHCIANMLLPEKNAVLSSDKRFVCPQYGKQNVTAESTSLSEMKFSDSQTLQVPRYFKPVDNLAAEEIDFLYGEVVLLDLKIY